jgi:hypothetical protein
MFDEFTKIYLDEIQKEIDKIAEEIKLLKSKEGVSEKVKNIDYKSKL